MSTNTVVLPVTVQVHNAHSYISRDEILNPVSVIAYYKSNSSTNQDTSESWY